MTNYSNIYKTSDKKFKNSLKNNLSYELIVIVKADELNEMSDILLNNIINAIKISNSESIQIIKTSDENQCKLSQIKDKIDGANLIIFGCKPQEIGIHLNVKTNEIIRFGNNQLLFTSSLNLMIEEQLKGKNHAKTMLWNSIKILFDI